MAANSTRIADEHGRAEAAGRNANLVIPFSRNFNSPGLLVSVPLTKKKIQRSFKGRPRRERRSM
jgi:hypothetical protein